MKRLFFEIGICSVVLTLGLAATFPQVTAAQAPQIQSSIRATSCTGLAAIQIENTTISSAKDVPDGTGVGLYGPQRAHCLVEGEINKRTGPDGVEYGDKFELRLPKAWGGRLLFQGGGGLDGTVNPAVGAMGTPGTSAKSALDRGYAVVSTDGGHQGKNPADASFGVDPGARADYEYRSTDLVASVAKKIVARYYGRAPEYSYMAGCSNGGREAMIAAQRYPADFDGVVAGDPAFNLTNAAIAEAWFTVKFAEISPKDSTGKPLLQQALTEPELNLLSSAVLKACDRLDGLADGTIDNPEACHFDPVALQCKTAKSDFCLSQAQVRAIQTTVAGPKNTAGEFLYSDWAYDSGIGAPGWRSWILGTAQMPAINVLIYPQFVNGIALLPGERPLSGPFAFDFDMDPPRINKSADLINAVSITMAPFRDRGAKIIFYTGMSDPVFSANDLIRYYRRLADDNSGMEAVRSFARLFRIPGMNHCFGGPALDNFDALTAIQNWVEKRNAPESIVATGKAFPGRSRPLCAYPDTPHYKGSGSTDDARNFVCQGSAPGGKEPGH
jgi:pimeloyl-ACP methyl ester carboxylesterase